MLGKIYWEAAENFEGKDAIFAKTGMRKNRNLCLEVTDTIRELIMKRANSRDIYQAVTAEGMTTMFEDGFKKALAGITTIEEILRIVHE